MFVFVDRNGSVFDCFGQPPSQDLLERAELLERSLPLDRTTPGSGDPGEGPTNVCVVGAVEFAGISHFSISLPQHPEILELPVCRKRIIGGVERTLSALGH